MTFVWLMAVIVKESIYSRTIYIDEAGCLREREGGGVIIVLKEVESCAGKH